MIYEFRIYLHVHVIWRFISKCFFRYICTCSRFIALHIWSPLRLYPYKTPPLLQ